MVGQYSFRWVRRSFVSSPSIPGFPLFLSTRFRAAVRFSRARTLSIRSVPLPQVSFLVCAGRELGSPVVPCGFTVISHSEGCCQLGCFLRSLLELPKLIPRFDVRPFPLAALALGTMASADSCRFS